MYLSVILSPKRPHSEWPTLSFVASLAALQTINSICPNVPASLKWPNDLIYQSKKVGGILVETQNLNKNFITVIQNLFERSNRQISFSSEKILES